MSPCALFRKPSIRGKLLLWFLAVALLPLMVAGYWGNVRSAQALREELTDSLIAVADAKVRQIGAYVLERKRNVTTLARNPTLIAAIKRFVTAYQNGGVDSPEYLAIEAELRPFLSFFQREHRYRDLFLISPAGDVVFSVAKQKDLGTNLVTGPYQDSELAGSFRQAATFHVTQISDFRYYPPSDVPAAFISAPVFQAGRLAGVVALHMNTDEIYDLAADYTGLGSTGETVIGARDGDEAVVVVPLRHDASAAFRKKTRLGSPTAIPLQQAVQGKRGFGIATDYRGEETWAVWRYFPDFRWGIVAKMDTSEVFEPVRRLQRWFVGVGLFTMLAVALAAVAVSRSISHPIAQLIGIVKSIAGGSFRERVAVTSADELGDLATEFNRMADQVCNSIERVSFQEARTKTILNSTADGIVTFGKDRTVLSLNAAAEKLFGYEAGETMGRNIAMLVPALGPDPHDPSAPSAVSPGASKLVGSESEQEGRHRTGHAIPLAIRVTETDYQGERVFIATLQDISERKRAERERRGFWRPSGMRSKGSPRPAARSWRPPNSRPPPPGSKPARCRKP